MHYGFNSISMIFLEMCPECAPIKKSLKSTLKSYKLWAGSDSISVIFVEFHPERTTN